MTTDEPDFQALYEPSLGKRSWMSPRMAYCLWSTAVYLADTWRANSQDPGPLLDELPPIARKAAHGEWLDRFIDCFDALAGKIAAGPSDLEGLASCTGEELALHLVIDLAEGHVADGVLISGTLRALPPHGSSDTDFDLMRDVLFADHDVLMLYEASLDGIDDPDTDVGSWARTVNLHPRDWFVPFELG